MAEIAVVFPKNSSESDVCGRMQSVSRAKPLHLVQNLHLMEPFRPYLSDRK